MPEPKHNIDNYVGKEVSIHVYGPVSIFMDGKLKMEDNPTEILKLSLKVGKTCGCHAEKGDKV